MAKTYDEIVSLLSLHMVTDLTDPDFVDFLPQAIEAAEARIYADIDLPSAETTQEFSISSGDKSIGWPIGMVMPERLTLTISGAIIPLWRRDYSFLDVYWPDRSKRGTPKYWATRDTSGIYFAPTASAAGTMTLLYRARPAPISATNQTTWLSTTFPDLLQYALLSYAAGYQKNFGANADDRGAPAGWEAQYAQRLQTARNEIARAKALGVFDVSPAPRPTSGEVA